MKRLTYSIFFIFLFLSGTSFGQINTSRTGGNSNDVLKSMRGTVQLIVHEQGVLKRYTTEHVIVTFDFSASKVKVYYSKDHLFFGNAIDAAPSQGDFELLVLPITEDFLGYFYSDSFRQISEIENGDNESVGNNFELVTIPVDRNRITKVKITGHLDCSYFNASQLKQCSKDALFSIEAYIRVDQAQGE